MKKTATTLALFMLISCAYAQLPKTLSFQGYLTSDVDEPITQTNLSATFALFTTSTGGTAIWGPEPHTINVDRGIFSTILGTTEPLNVSTDLQFDRAYFLEIAIDGETLSRIPVTPGIYSLSTINAANITTNMLAIANGGTNASTTTEARTNLGLAIGADVQAYDADLTTYGGISPSTDIQAMLGSASNASIRSNIGLGSVAIQDANAVSITGGAVSGITDLAIADGGTGAGTAEAARTNLGLGTLATQSANSVNITGGAVLGITDLAIADGGTGASTADDARSNLGLEIGVDVQGYDGDLSTFAGISPSTDVQTLLGSATNTAIRSTIGLGSIATQDASSVSISGGSISGITDLAIADGGTGASTAGDAQANLGLEIGVDVQGYDADLSTFAGISPSTDVQTLLGSATNTAIRSNIGLGSIATQDASSVSISGGSISGITDLAIADGGTGAGTATAARTNLGLEIGSDIQAYDAALDDISGLGVADGNIIVGNGTSWVAESGTTARTSLGVAIGSDVQAYDAGLNDIAGLAVTNGNVIVGNGTNWVAESGSTARASLGLTIGSDVQAYDADLDDLALDGSLSGSRVDPAFGAQTITTTAGLHVGGTSDPGTDNMRVDGTLIVGENSSPSTTFEVVHSDGNPSGGDGLTITGDDGTDRESWTLYSVPSNGNLVLYQGTTAKGVFNASSGVYTDLSDRRVKKNLNPLNDVLYNVNRISTYQFHFIDQSENEEKMIGVIAQELKELYPSLIEYLPNEDLYTVNYTGLGVLAIKAIQEQQDIIDSLSSEVIRLKEQHIKMEAHGLNMDEKLRNQEQKIEALFRLFENIGMPSEPVLQKTMY